MLSEAILVAAALSGQPGARDLDPLDLHSASLREVYRAILSTPEPVDVGLVAAALPPRIESHPTTTYLARLLDGVPVSARLDDHLAVIRGAAARRRLAHAAAAGAASVADAPDLAAWVDDHAAELRALAATATADRSYPTVTGAELARPIPDVPWLVPAMQLAPGRPSILAAYGGSGKTWLACDLALALAGRRSAVLGGAWSTARSGPVLHLNYEMSHPALLARYQRLALGRGDDLSSADLHVSSRSHLGGDDLTSPTFARRLTDTIRATGAVLVVVDSLRAATAGVDENSSDARRYLDTLLGVSDDTGATVLVIHHEGKPPVQGSRETIHRLRGSSSLVDACDTTWHLVALSDGSLRCEPGKSSRGGRAEPVTARLVDLDDGSGGIRWDYQDPEQIADALERQREQLRRDQDGAVEDSILRALSTHGPLSTLAIRSGTKLGIKGQTNARRQAILRMEADGVIQKSSGSRGAVIWTLV